MTPSNASIYGNMTPPGSTPVSRNVVNSFTPYANLNVPITPEQMHAQRNESELDEHNRQLTDEELDEMLPPGFKVLPTPEGYVPIRKTAR